MKNKTIKGTKLKRNVEGEIVGSVEDAYFPPIVGTDPELAAISIPIEEQETAYFALLSSFEALKENKSTHKYLEECMLSNKSTFMWFCTFFKTLEQQINPPSKYTIPYHLYSTGSIDEHFFFFQYPMYLIERKDKFVVQYKKIVNEASNKDLIARHKINLISNRYESTDFRNGFPNWYITSGTIFEKYSSKINKRVRIVNNNGEFQYFICGASDNWEQIYNVPLEIDDVIACILFQN